MNLNPINSEDFNSTIKEIKNFRGGLNLGVIYIIFFIISIALIYFYTVYQNEFYTILIPFTTLWSVLIIVLGISLFKVNNTASFSMGVFITLLSVAGTISSIFVRVDNIDTSFYPTYFDIGANMDKMYTGIDVRFTDMSIKTDNITNFKSETSSNYDNLTVKTSIDDYGISNFNLKQTLLPPGIGDYYKKSNLIFPNKISTVINMNLEFSNLNANLSGLRLVSGELKSRFSNIYINIDNIEEDATLDINSLFSQVKLNITSNIDVDLTSSSTLSQNNLTGIVKTDDESNIYRTKNNKNKLIDSDIKLKKLTINLTSTLSRIEIIQE